MPPTANACGIIVSGSIPHGPTTCQVTYFVVDRVSGAVLGDLTLPDAATFASSFRLLVRMPRIPDSLDVGVFDEARGFVSAGFTVETLQSAGAVG